MVPFDIGGNSLICELQFDEEEPLEVEFFFDEDDEVVWTIGRDLLLSGMDSESWVGEGMVSLRRDDHNTIAMVLRPADGAMPATLLFRRRPLLAFLTHTYALVHAGQEFDGFDWDAFEEDRANW